MQHRSLLLVIGVIALVVASVPLWLRGNGESSLEPTVGPGDGDRTVLEDMPSSLDGGGHADRKEAEPAGSVLDPETGGDAATEWTTTLRVVEHGSGRPLAGALVSTFEDSTPGERTTDADGYCTFRVPGSEDTMLLLVEKEGYFHVRGRFFRRAELTLRLHTTTTLRGLVVDSETKAPITGASVELGPVHGSCKQCQSDVVSRGNDGSYELAGVSIGVATTFVLAAPDYPTDTRRFELRPDGAVRHNFEMERGRTVMGRVVDFTTGAPVVGATLRTGSHELTTDAAGAFRGRFLRSLLEVSAEGYCRLRAPFGDENPEGAELMVRLPRGAVVAGVVHGPGGEPIEGARVGLGRDYREQSRRKRSGETTEPTPLDELPTKWTVEEEGFQSALSGVDGRFELSGVVPWDRDLQLTVGHDGFHRARLPVQRVGGPTEMTWVDCVLRPRPRDTTPGGSIVGLLRINGSPVYGEVSWKGQTRDGGGRANLLEYELSAVESGDVVLVVKVDGYPGLFEDSGATVHVRTDGRVRHDFDLRIPSGEIRGRVTYDDGRAAAGITVSAGVGPLAPDTRKNRLYARAPTGADGTYVLHPPDLGLPCTVSLDVANKGYSRDDIRLPASGVDFVVTRPGQLLYRARDAISGDPVSREDFELSWSPSGEEAFKNLDSSFSSAPDQDGWYMAHLPASNIDLRVRSDRLGYRPMRIENIFVRGEEMLTRVDIDLEQGLEARFVLMSKEPIPPGHTVVLLDPKAWERVRDWHDDGSNRWASRGFFPGFSVSSRILRFDGEGQGRIGALAAGRYRFRVFPDDVALEPEEVDVQGDGDPIEVRWRPR